MRICWNVPTLSSKVNDEAWGWDSDAGGRQWLDDWVAFNPSSCRHMRGLRGQLSVVGGSRCRLSFYKWWVSCVTKSFSFQEVRVILPVWNNGDWRGDLKAAGRAASVAAGEDDVMQWPHEEWQTQAWDILYTLKYHNDTVLKTLNNHVLLC